MLEPTRGEKVLDKVLSSQKELVDNVKIHEPLGNSDHNQIHFDIDVKSTNFQSEGEFIPDPRRSDRENTFA